MTQESHNPEEIIIGKDTSTSMFIAATSTIARTCKQPRCPSTDEWMKKTRYINTMESYSAVKRNTSESVSMRRLNLGPVIQSKVSQKEKNKYHILTHIYGIKKDYTDKPICRTALEMQT